MEGLIIIVLVYIEIHLLLLIAFLSTTIVAMVVTLLGRVCLTASLMLIVVMLHLHVLDTVNNKRSLP